MRAVGWTAVAALVATASRSARAEQPPPAASADPPVTAPTSAPSRVAPASPPPSPKRELPNYDGRGAAPATAGAIALWVPRVILLPLYLTIEWLVRRPLGAVVSAAERANLPTLLYDFFAFGPDHKAGVTPIAFVDFGFNPSIGVYGFWDDAFFKGDALRAHVSFWPEDWIGGSVVQHVRFYGKDTVQLRLAAVRRPDHVFYGVGPRSLESAQSRYGADSLDFGILADFPMWRASKIDVGGGVRSMSFRNGHFGDDPGILESVAAGLFPLPDGYRRGYVAAYSDLRFALDSRRAYPAEGSGVRLEAQAEQGSDLRESAGSGWIHTAAGAGGSWDVNGNRRVLSLSLLAMSSDPLGERPVPFTELVTLGGDSTAPGSFASPMPGFFPGRLVGRSAAVATLRYKWPIGPWIAGSLQGALGNVFGAQLQGFATDLLRFSGAVGIESDSSPDSSFEFILGLGTETFEHGTQVDSLRLAVGITRF